MSTELKVEQLLKPLQDFIETLEESEKRVVISFCILNLLSHNLDEFKALGLLAKIKHLLLTVEPLPEEASEPFYVS